MKEKIEKWMGKTNMIFTHFAAERVTNAEVVYAHIGLFVFLLILCIAGNFE